MDKVLYKLYYTDLNLDGARELYRKAKEVDNNIKYVDVQEWLKKQSTHQQTTVPKVGKHIYQKIYAENINSYQMDLTFLPKYKSANKDNYVLFTAININSRYAYASYGKDKSTDTIIKMMEQFKKEAKEVESITCDSGSEFTNNIITNWFTKNNIKTYFVIGDSHILGIINRFHRTLKGKLLKYFIATDNYTWINILDQIIKNYNNTINTGIGFKPSEANNNTAILSYIISKARGFNEKLTDNHKQTVFVGDKCRIKTESTIYDKMKVKYSNDIYTIIKVNKNRVDISNDKKEITNIKITDIIVVNDVENYVKDTQKKIIEKSYKVSRKLKQINMNEDNIINSKRIIKKREIYDI